MAGIVRRLRDFISRRTKTLVILSILILGGLMFVIYVASSFLAFPRKGSVDLPSLTPIQVPEEAAIVWNAWMSREGESFSPVDRLAAESDALVTLHLSSFDYRTWNPAVSSSRSSEDVRQTLDELLRNHTGPNAEFTVLFLADPLFFDLPNANGVVKLPVDLNRVRETLKAPELSTSDPFRTMSQDSDAGFILGRVSLPLHTTKREGETAIGISIWQGIRPIDEISVPVCVGAREGCVPGRALKSSLRGQDSLRISLAAPASLDTYPDAALHFVDLNGGKTVGVFHRKDWPESRFLAWRLDDSPAALREWLKDSFIPAFRNVGRPSVLTSLGRGLFERLFPDGPDAAEARKEFIGFFKEQRFSVKNPKLPPSSIFIRMFPQAADPLPILPAGLLAVPLTDDESNLGYLGLEFRVETPLEVQDYSVPAACASNWAMLVPPAGSEWDDTRARLTGDLTQWQSTRSVYDSISGFGTWLNASHDLPTVLVTLSHHDHDSLYFDSSEKLMSTGVRRDFTSPSIAILDGCGTGNIGAVDWVRALNRHHVNTVIATSTEIRPALAADFLATLDQTISNQPKPGMSAALALFKTMRTLSTKKASRTDGEYGPLVLAYSLLGNGHIRICPPEQRRQ